MVFLEIVFDAGDLSRSGSDRDAIETALDKALSDAGLGVVTGGGTGRYASIVEVEIYDSSKLEQGLQLIRRTLTSANAPPSTLIKGSQPEKLVIRLG
jgi:hypothetical protein